MNKHIQKVVGFLCTSIGILGLLYYLPYLYAQTKSTIVEVKVVCTNTTDIKITDATVEKYLKGAKIIGEPFDTPHNTQCYILAKKYNPNTTGPEIIKAIDQIVLSTSGLGTSL